MLNYVKKTKYIRRYTKSLEIHTGTPNLHWEDNTSCIYVVEYKIFTPRVKTLTLLSKFLQEKFENGNIVPKYEKTSFMPVDVCTKPCSVPIIIQSTK